MRPTLTLALVLAAGLAACDESPTSPTEIQDVTWKLETVERDGASTLTVPDPDRYTLRLEANARAAVRSDCNSCSGPYTISGTSLDMGALACTRAFCGDSSLDTPFTTALGTARSISVTETRLVIRGNGVVLRFRN